MERLTRPWGLLGLSTVISVIAGIAILAFGAPAWILILVAWGGAVLGSFADAEVKRRLDRRR